MTANYDATRHAIDVHANEFSFGEVTTIAHGSNWRVMRRSVAAEESLPPHSAPGDVIVYCLEGRIVVDGFETLELREGQLCVVPAGRRHALRGLQTSAVLLFIAETPAEPLDVVQEASEESFPASDPPSYASVTRP